MEKYRGSVDNEHAMMDHYESWWYDTHGDPHSRKDSPMTKADEIRALADKQREMKELVAAELQKGNDAVKAADRARLVASVIEKTWEEIRKAAMEGEFSTCAIQYASSDCGFAEIQTYFRNNGFQTHVDEMKSFGSYPLFYHTVYSLYIDWYPRRKMTDTVSLKEAQKEIHEKMAAMKVELKTIGEKLFRDGSQDIFDTFPNVGSFSWTQYTPYWNDGEPCSFGVNDYFEVNDTKGELLYEEVSSSGYYIDRKLERGEELNEEDLLGQALDELVGGIDEDTMLALFGDHVRITVTREGIDIEEYEHE